MLEGNRHIVSVNSRARISGTDENFNVQIRFPSNHNFNRVTCLGANIPKNYYLISEPRNTFTLEENSATTTITMPVGNYSLTSLRNKLSSLLTAGSATLGNNFTYSVTVNDYSTEPVNGKLIYSVSDNGGVQQKIIVTDLFEPLGFVENSTNVFIADTVTSTNVIKLQLEDNLFIKSDICRNGRDTTLIEVHSHEADFSTISFTNYAPALTSRNFVGQNNNTFDFSLVNEDGNLMKLNGLNMTLTLLFYTEKVTLSTDNKNNKDNTLSTDNKR